MMFSDEELDVVRKLTRTAFGRGVAVGLLAAALIHLVINTSVHFTWH